jgi:transcriptional regulator with XRE-family HTH domain
MAGPRLSPAFAKALRSHRKAKGISRERLAHAAGLHRTYVGLIERGQRNPTLDAAHALARALGMRLSELVREAERAG